MDSDKEQDDTRNIEFLRIVASHSEATAKITQLMGGKGNVNINYQDSETGDSALHIAVKGSDQQLAEYLMDIGIDISLRNKEGLTAGQLAKNRGIPASLVNLFAGNGRLITGLFKKKIFSLDLSIPFSWEEILDAIAKSEIAVIKLFNSNGKISPLEIIKDNSFCKAVNASPFLFIVDIEVDGSDKYHQTELLEFNSKIDKFRPIVVQFRNNISGDQIIFYREPNKPASFWIANGCEKIQNDEYLTAADGFDLKMLLTMLAAGYGGHFSGDLLRCTFDSSAHFDYRRFIDYATHYSDALSLRLMLLLGKWDLYMRNNNNERILEIAAEHSDAQIISSILNLPLYHNLSPVVLSEYNKELVKLRGRGGKTPFSIAAEMGNVDALRLFIHLGLGKEEDDRSLMDDLWQRENYKILAMLLDNDFPFPSMFRSNCNHSGLQKIVKSRISFHNAIRQNDKKNVLRFIASNANIKNAYNTDNKTALETALESNNIHIFALLQFKGFIKNDRIAKLMDELERKGEEDKIQKETENFFDELEDGHILHLISKTKHATEIDKSYFFKKTEELYNILDQIPQISQVMKLLKHSDDLVIVLDFSSDSIRNMDLTCTDAEIAGRCFYESGKIFIGAKRQNRAELLGTLAHELTHLALQVRYNNKTKPFDCLDTLRNECFTEIINTFEMEKHCDKVIKEVFHCYDRDDWPSELIVRVNQIMAQYRGDALQKLEDARLLTDWYDENIKPDFEKFLENPTLYKNEKKIQQFNIEHGLIPSFEEIKLNEEILYSSMPYSQFCSIIVSEYPKLDILNLYQTFSEHWTTSHISRNVIFLSSEGLNNKAVVNYIRRLSESNVNIRLIIDCTGIEVEIEGTVEHILRKDSAILLATKEQSTKIAEALFIRDENIFNFETQYNFQHLSELSKDFLLNREVVFQNISLNLGDIISKDTPVLQHLLLEHLLYNETFNIDKALIDRPRYFIDRTFENPVEIHSFEGWIGERVFTYEDFNSACESKPNYNIHLFYILGDKKYSVKSRIIVHGAPGSNMRIKKYIDTCNEDILNFATARKLILLSDLPGMGKSTLISKLAEMAKKEKRNRWVSVIRLNEYTDAFYENRHVEFVSSSQAVCFVANNLLKLKSSFEKEFFRYACMEEKSLVQVAIFFDGIDEISPIYYDLLIELIKKLQTTLIEQIWMSSRTHLADKLEQVFQIIRIEMKPLSKDEQVACLSNFWREIYSSEKEESKIKLFAEKLIEKTKFVGTPLLLSLLADVYRENVKVLCECDEDVRAFDVAVEICTILELYINEKIYIYQVEKSKTLQSNVAAVERCNREKKELLKAHTMLALQLIFTDVEYLRDNIRKIKYTAEELSRIGLVTVTNNGSIFFIHRAFAEYFVARFCLPHIVDYSDNLTILAFLAQKVFLWPEFNVVRNFLGEMITKPFAGPILEHIKDIQTCRNILKVFVSEPTGNLVKYLFLGLDSLKQKETIECLMSIIFESKGTGSLEILKILNEGGYNARLDKHFCYGIFHACKNGEIDKLECFKKIYSRSNGKNWERILEFGWSHALQIGELDILRILYSWIAKENPHLEKALFLKESTWIAVASAKGDTMLQALRSWNGELSNDELKGMLMKKSIWEAAVCTENIGMLRTLWEWCKHVDLGIDERQTLISHLELCLYITVDEITKLYTDIIYEIGPKFKTVKNILKLRVLHITIMVDCEKWIRIFIHLIFNFKSNNEDFEILFIAICNSFVSVKVSEYREIFFKFDLFGKLWLLAEKLQILKNVILHNWQIACRYNNKYLLDRLWECMKNAGFTVEEKRSIVFDEQSLVWALRNYSFIRENFWQWEFELRFTKKELENILKIIWRIFCYQNDISQMEILRHFFSQEENSSCYLKVRELSMQLDIYMEWLTKINNGYRGVRVSLEFPCGETRCLPLSKFAIRTVINSDFMIELIIDENSWKNAAGAVKKEGIRTLISWSNIYSIQNDTMKKLTALLIRFCCFKEIMEMPIGNKTMSDKADKERIDFLINVWKHSITTQNLQFVKILMNYANKIPDLHENLKKTPIDLEICRKLSRAGQIRLLETVFNFVDNDNFRLNILNDHLVWSLAAENGQRRVLEFLWKKRKEMGLDKCSNYDLVNLFRRAATHCNTRNSHDEVMTWFFKKCNNTKLLDEFFQILDEESCACLPKLMESSKYCHQNGIVGKNSDVSIVLRGNRRDLHYDMRPFHCLYT